MKNNIFLSSVVVASSLLLFGCNANNVDISQTANVQDEKPAVSMTPVTPPALTEEQNAQLKAGQTAHKPKNLTFTVVGGNFFYVPSEIKVKKGDTVKIVFQNNGGTHNFNLDEFGVKGKTIKTGETDTVQFVADKIGTFEYYCSIGQHRKMGQRGNLIVE